MTGVAVWFTRTTCAARRRPWCSILMGCVLCFDKTKEGGRRRGERMCDERMHCFMCWRLLAEVQLLRDLRTRSLLIVPGRGSCAVWCACGWGLRLSDGQVAAQKGHDGRRAREARKSNSHVHTSPQTDDLPTTTKQASSPCPPSCFVAVLHAPFVPVHGTVAQRRRQKTRAYLLATPASDRPCERLQPPSLTPYTTQHRHTTQAMPALAAAPAAP